MTPLQVYEENVRNPKCPTYPYLEFLRRKGKGNVLEIGVETGVSTACFICGVHEQGGHVWSVDINPSCWVPYSGDPRWTFIASDSQDVTHVKSKIPEVLDVLMIDGWHEHPVPGNDLKNYAPMVKSGGLIIMHDIRMQDVMDAYHQFLVETGYVHFELGGYSESPYSGAMAWGLGVIYVG